MFCIKRVYFCLILALLSLTLITSRKRNTNTWKLDRVKCSSSFCSTHYCKVVRKSSHQQVLDVLCTLDQQVNAVLLYARLHYRYQTTYRKFMFDLNLDMCDYLGERKQFQPMLDAFSTYIEKYSNLSVCGNCRCGWIAI